MKKILVVVAILVVVGGVLGWVFRKPIALAFASRETRACAKLADLCAAEREAKASDIEVCENAWTNARKIAGEKNVEKSLGCIEEAETCAKATGCMLGGVGVGAAQELIQGVGEALLR
jgi:hypothetical protein